MTVLLTRPEPASREIAEALAALGIASTVWPLTRIVALPGPVAPPPGTEALVFTSRNGLAHFAGAASERDLPAYCVGPGTAAGARHLGFGDIRDAGGDVAALAGLIARGPETRLYHPRGRDSAGELAGELAAMNKTLVARAVYAAEPCPEMPAAVAEGLETGAFELITVWSPRNGAILAEHLAGRPVAQIAALGLLTISANAADPLKPLNFRDITVSPSPDRAAMMGEITRLSAAKQG